MLTRLSKRFRFKAAFALAVAYAFCALVPSAAHAFADSATSHRLADHHGIVTVHEHGGKPHVHGGVNQHEAVDTASQAPEQQGKSHYGSCCGVFCVAAIAVEPDVLVTTVFTGSVGLFPPDVDRGGRGPDRIHRPPIS